MSAGKKLAPVVVSRRAEGENAMCGTKKNRPVVWVSDGVVDKLKTKTSQTRDLSLWGRENGGKSTCGPIIQFLVAVGDGRSQTI